MTFDEQLERAFGTLADRLREEVAHHVRVATDDVSAAAHAELTASALVERTAADTRAAMAERAAITRLAAGVHAVGQASSLTTILLALLHAAAQEAARAALVMTRGDRFHGWRSEGFGASLEIADKIDMGSADAGVIAEAARTGKATLANSADRAAVPVFVDLAPGHDCAAIPLIVGRQTVAVLYVDQAISSLAALEILADHAARCLESATAVALARTFPRDSPQGSHAPDEDRAHVEELAAERFAHLLVSEIKLQHEEEVAAGRRERDLATRLGAEIAQARVSYEEHVSVAAQTGHDFFDAELVRTLAGGDASLLDIRR